MLFCALLLMFLGQAVAQGMDGISEEMFGAEEAYELVDDIGTHIGLRLEKNLTSIDLPEHGMPFLHKVRLCLQHCSLDCRCTSLSVSNTQCKLHAETNYTKTLMTDQEFQYFNVWREILDNKYSNPDPTPTSSVSITQPAMCA